MASGTEQLRALAVALGNAPRVGFDAAKKANEDAGTKLRDQWRTNATATAGKAAKLYPPTITSEPAISFTSLSVEVGPEERGQGDLGLYLELGSSNNPPHMDGNRAADVIEPHYADDILKAVTDAIDNLL